MASDTIYIVKPKAAHTHTVIFLHGRDSSCKEFADELFESEASQPMNQPRTLLDLFPNIRWSVGSPAEYLELQHPGLHQSIKKILEVIKKEEMLVPRKRIFFAEISQGFATIIATFFADKSKRFSGLIGLCSWMPVTLRNEDYRSFEDTANTDGLVKSSYNTPVFLSHSADDDVVPIKNGRELRDILQSRQLQVEWREYEDGGHWVNEPRGVDDIVRFISRHMVGNHSEVPEE
ncbi:lysophospholipase II [Xylaria curta]|nr:lysophospholipase II [Xylaria curta]